MKNLEIRTIEHKGVRVAIKIDYDAGLVSFVESSDGYKIKKWIFANRGLEYMNGWLDILEAMVVATKECKKELEADLATKSRFIEDEMVAQLVVEKRKKKK